MIPKKKVWDEAAREAERVKWYAERKEKKRKNYKNYYDRKRRVDEVWVRMGKKSYTRKEILKRLMILEGILRNKYMKGDKIVIDGFGSIWYEIYDYRKDGVIGHEGKVKLSVLKPKFRAGKWLIDALNKEHKRRNTDEEKKT